MAGTVLGIHFTDPQHIVVVFNIKYKTEVIKYIARHERDFKKNNPTLNFNEVMRELKLCRRISPRILQWIQPRLRKENINPKHDHYGLPAGKIDEYWITLCPTDYFDYAIAAEFVEETEKSIVREVEINKKRTRISLFKRIVMLYSKNFENGKNDYENYFFHILEADGEWGKQGFPEETEALEIVPITNLHPPGFKPWPKGAFDFYIKHGLGVKICLRQLVHEQGKEEYRSALEHMEKLFPREAKDIGLFEEIKPPEPTLDLSDDELWEHFIKGKEIKKL